MSCTCSVGDLKSSTYFPTENYDRSALSVMAFDTAIVLFPMHASFRLSYLQKLCFSLRGACRRESRNDVQTSSLHHLWTISAYCSTLLSIKLSGRRFRGIRICSKIPNPTFTNRWHAVAGMKHGAYRSQHRPIRGTNLLERKCLRRLIEFQNSPQVNPCSSQPSVDHVSIGKRADNLALCFSIFYLLSRGGYCCPVSPQCCSLLNRLRQAFSVLAPKSSSRESFLSSQASLCC